MSRLICQLSPLRPENRSVNYVLTQDTSGRTKEISRYCLDQTSDVARFFFPLPFGAVPFRKLSKLNCWNRRLLAVGGRFSALFQQFRSSSLWVGRTGERL